MKEYIITEHPLFPYEDPKPPELVRCKDCKHYERLMHLCRKFDEYGLAESDYCSRGERKEGEE